MDLQTIKELISENYPEAIVGEDLTATPAALLVHPKFITGVCDFLHTNEHTYFDVLSCLTGIDNGPENGTMEVVYNLYSIPFDTSLMIRVTLDRSNPVITTVSTIWRTANWHEREAFDLLGIQFQNHPDLRRILLPKDWVGHPLRKDYTEQETYHGMTVVYDREEEANWSQRKEESVKLKEKKNE